MNPTKGKGERYIYCLHDGGECLDLVTLKGWSSFNCGQCEIYLQSETYQEKLIKDKKKEAKEKEEMAEKATVINPDEKNQLIDLNNALFSQLDRLTNDELDDEKLKKEILRSKAVSNLAAQIIQNAKLALEGAKAIKANEVDRGTLMLGRGK